MPSVETHNELYTAADTAARAHDWETLWSLRDRLRDTGSWPGGYGIGCAIAGWHVDPPAGLAMLDEVIDAGFHQPELWQPELDDAFAEQPGWAERVARMQANVPPPKIVLVDWPDSAPTLAPTLDSLEPDRDALLRERLPELDGSAWESALRILAWTTSQWEHANGHIDRRDAVDVLDRAAAGERFACVEYSIVLSQALNAARIPARTLSLRMGNYHTGFGRGHVVSEAWIDDLGAWVLLDGQNGAWWGDDRPLGIVELMGRHATGERPPMNSTEHELSDSDQAEWFTYFHSATTTGLTWSNGPYVPVFQDRFPVMTEHLVHGSDHAAPDLSALATALVDASGAPSFQELTGDPLGPAVAFTPLHPYATGVVVVGDDDVAFDLGVGEPFALKGEPGRRTFSVSAVTPYGSLAASALAYDLV